MQVGGAQATGGFGDGVGQRGQKPQQGGQGDAAHQHVELYGFVFEHQDAPLEIDLLVDLTYNLIVGRGGAGDRRALNVNTVDEVPDSNWFTNRIARPGSGERLTPEAIANGPNTGAGPAAPSEAI